MDFDFNLILVPLTLLAVGITAGYALWSRNRVRAGLPVNPHPNFMVRTAREFWLVLLVVLGVRSFIAEPFQIPSESMLPTLKVGDFILVNKASYGMRLPLLNIKVVPFGEPKRGEVVVFRYPLNPARNYIKRVVGLPGDLVTFKDGHLFINRQPVPVVAEPALAQSPQEEISRETLGTHSHLVRNLVGASLPPVMAPVETAQGAVLMEPVVYQTTRELGKQPEPGKFWETRVPAGQYFVMGDNRDQSLDGRFWGFVPENNLVGKAEYIWVHKPGWSLPSFSRNGFIN